MTAGDHPAPEAAGIPPFPSLRGEAPDASDEPANPTTTRRRGPYKKTQATRDAILRAAMEVFAVHGYNAGSLREIGERVGLDRSSLLHHFPTKSDLLLAVMHERDRRADEILASAHPDTADDLPRAVLALAEHNADTPGVIALYSLLAAESVTPDHPLGEYFTERTRRVRAGLETWLAQAEADGMLRDGVSASFAATSFFALWEGVQLHWVIDPERVDVVATLRGYLDLIFRDWTS